MQQFRFWAIGLSGLLMMVSPAWAMNAVPSRQVMPLIVAEKTMDATVEPTSDVLMASYSRPRMRNYGHRQVHIRRGLPSQRAGLPSQQARLPQKRSGLKTVSTRMPKHQADLPSQKARLPKQRADLPKQRHQLKMQQADLPSYNGRLPRYRSKPHRYRGSLRVSY